MSASTIPRSRGIFLKLPAPEVVELAAQSGLDFVVIDLEHSTLGESEARELVRRAHFLDLPAIVRLPHVDSALINRLLEDGAAGIQISSVTSAATVVALVRATRFAPDGDRSLSLAQRAAGFGAVAAADVVAAERARPPLTVIQIETASTVDQLDEIAAAGADVMFIGQLDLSVALEFHPDLLAQREKEIAAAAERAGIRLGGIDPSRGESTYDVIGSDLSILRVALLATGGSRVSDV